MPVAYARLKQKQSYSGQSQLLVQKNKSMPGQKCCVCGRNQSRPYCKVSPVSQRTRYKKELAGPSASDLKSSSMQSLLQASLIIMAPLDLLQEYLMQSESLHHLHEKNCCLLCLQLKSYLLQLGSYLCFCLGLAYATGIKKSALLQEAT